MNTGDLTVHRELLETIGFVAVQGSVAPVCIPCRAQQAWRCARQGLARQMARKTDPEMDENPLFPQYFRAGKKKDRARNLTVYRKPVNPISFYIGSGTTARSQEQGSGEPHCFFLATPSKPLVKLRILGGNCRRDPVARIETQEILRFTEIR